MRDICKEEPIKTVGELVAKLQTMPQDAPVGCVWDDKIRTKAEYVWVSKSGVVAIAHGGARVDGEDCPDGYEAYETPWADDEW